MRLFAVPLSAAVLFACGSVKHPPDGEARAADPWADGAPSQRDDSCEPIGTTCRDCGDGAYAWSRLLGGNKEDFGRSLAVAENGDVLLAGSFAESLEICNTDVQSVGRRDGFVVRFDGDGRALWHREFGSDAGPTVIEAVALRADGNVLVTGSEPGFADAADASATIPRAAFVTELTSDGTPQWTRYFPSRESAVGTSVAIAPDGALLVTGSFSTMLDLGDDRSLTTQGSYSAFVAKLSHTGELRWAKTIGGADTAIGRNVAVDSQGNVFVLVDAGTEIALVLDGSPFPSAELAVVSFDPAGTLREVVPITYDSSHECDCLIDGLDLKIGPDDSVYVAGAYSEAAVEHAVFFQEAFVQRMPPGGAFSIVASWSGSARALAVAPEGDLLVAGDFFDTTDLGGHQLTAIAFSDGFAARFDPSGGVTWATGFGSFALDTCHAAALGPAGEMYIAGAIGDHHATSVTVDFGGGSASTYDQTDAFVAKYAW